MGPLGGFYELADNLIVLNEVFCREVSNLARQQKFKPEVGDDPPVRTHLTVSLWLLSMEPTITNSTSRKNVAAAEKNQVESVAYRLTQELGRWPFLNPRLENVTDRTRESAPPLVKQIWAFLEEQLEVAEEREREREREMTVARFVTAANEVTIGGFWSAHAKGKLRTRRSHEILKFLSPCWEKEYMDKVFYAGNAISEVFVQELLSMPINLLLTLYLVYPRYLFNMGPAYMFSRGVETLRNDGYLTVILLTHGELTTFHRLKKYGEPLSVRKAHSSPETYSYKCAAGLKALLVEPLLLQNRHLTGEERSAKTREEVREANRGIPLLTDLCLAMRSEEDAGFDASQVRGSGGAENSRESRTRVQAANL